MEVKRKMKRRGFCFYNESAPSLRQDELSPNEVCGHSNVAQIISYPLGYASSDDLSATSCRSLKNKQQVNTFESHGMHAAYPHSYSRPLKSQS